MNSSKTEYIVELKSVEFDEAYTNSNFKNQEGLDVRYLHLNELIQSKKAAGRHKDLDDIEKLSS